MFDFLDYIVRITNKTIKDDYYDVSFNRRADHTSLKESIIKTNVPAIIAEIKHSSPAVGLLKRNIDVQKVAVSMEKGGAVGISVITEPKCFKGSIHYIPLVREVTKIPILMKDFVINPIQIKAAEKLGADSVLLIKSIFDRKLTEISLDEMIDFAKKNKIEVLLEVHDEEEFLSSLQTEADIIGINNRDLSNLNVSLETTKKIMSKNRDKITKLVISESGIKVPNDIKILHNLGVDAFLIGTALVTAENVEEEVRKLVEAV